MDSWKKKLADSITSADDIPSRLNADKDHVREVARRYPMRITPHYLGLVREEGDPIWRQCIPDLQELSDELLLDPLNEAALSPVPGLIHRYPDRVVWLISSACAVYCRFCMRKGRVGCGRIASGCGTSMENALEYIAGNETIRDVVLSGGDPLLLEDDMLDWALAQLRKIAHVEIIRIGTRVPVTLPERITPRLCRMLRRYHPVYVNTHFNHPLEITPESSVACTRLAAAGIPLGNQTVLLRGINDSLPVMKRLMQSLLAIRVRPYYLHQMDLVKGTGHFRTTVAQGIQITESLRGHTSGLANPHYVIDLPGGKGKVPLGPDCVRYQGGKLLLTNYLGETVEYPDAEG